MKKKTWIFLMAFALLFSSCGRGYEVVISGSSMTEAASAEADDGGSAESGVTGEGGDAEKSGGSEKDGTGSTASGSGSGKESAQAVPLIYVYVCGAVKNPGVYQLRADSRVYEAVQAAGGFTENADSRSLNQAQILEDGEQITVLTAEEAASGGVSGIAGGAGNSDSGTGTSQTAGNAGENAKVNINTATKEELMTLPGIGESRAEAIIAYREENGSFRSIEDIMKIEGIKEKMYAKLQDKIAV